MASKLSLREFDSQSPKSDVRHHADENYKTNAWHSMTAAFHQISENDASRDPNHPQSFLAKQRISAALKRIRLCKDKPS